MLAFDRGMEAGLKSCLQYVYCMLSRRFTHSEESHPTRIIVSGHWNTTPISFMEKMGRSEMTLLIYGILGIDCLMTASIPPLI